MQPKVSTTPDVSPPSPTATDSNDDQEQRTQKPTKQDNNQYFALTEDNLFESYAYACTYTDLINQPFPEYSRIAHSMPYAGLPKKYPRVTEGSSGSFIEQKPRDLIQQAPSGVITTEGNLEWLNIVGQWIFDNQIIPNAKEDYPVFEKAQNNLEQALTVGCTLTTAPFYNHNGIWSADMTSEFWGDVKIPQGYKSVRSMPYVFFDGWWVPEKIDALLANPKAAADAGWIIANLQQVKEVLSQKDWKAQTPVEKNRGLPEKYVTITKAEQDGVNAPIYTFNPDSKLILRIQQNDDPRGVKNVQTLYGKIDGTNPLGVSVLERGVGSWQNVMDNDVQAYNYNRIYNMDPATKRIGNIGDGDLHPGASFTAQTSDDDISTIELNSESLTNFPTTYEWSRGILLNRLNSPTSAGDGDAPLGTTPKGIATAQSILSTDDLTFVQHTHDWFQEWGEAATNITFARRHGKQTLELDQQTADQLRALAEESDGDGNPKFDLSLLNGNNLIFDFDQKLPIFRFSVDGGSSKLQDEASQLQALNGISERIESNPTLQQLTGELMQAKIYNKMILLSGVHDSEDLLIDLKTLEQQIQEQQQNAESEDSIKAQEAKPPTLAIAFKDLGGLPDGARVKAQLETLKMFGINSVSAQDLAAPPPPTTDATGNPVVPGSSTPPAPIVNAVTNLQKAGVPEILIPHAIQALTEHVPLEDVLTAHQEMANAA